MVQIPFPLIVKIRDYMYHKEVPLRSFYSKGNTIWFSNLCDLGHGGTEVMNPLGYTVELAVSVS